VGHPQIGDHRIQTLEDKASMASRPNRAQGNISAFAQPVGQTASHLNIVIDDQDARGLDMFMTKNGR